MASTLHVGSAWTNEPTPRTPAVCTAPQAGSCVTGSVSPVPRAAKPSDARWAPTECSRVPCRSGFASLDDVSRAASTPWDTRAPLHYFLAEHFMAHIRSPGLQLQLLFLGLSAGFSVLGSGLVSVLASAGFVSCLVDVLGV